jgi:hypothetical protein
LASIQAFARSWYWSELRGIALLRCEKRGQLWVVLARLAQHLRNPIRMLDAHGDHSEALVGTAVGMFGHQLDDLGHLGIT